MSAPSEHLHRKLSLEEVLLDHETKLMDPEVLRSEKASDFIADDFMEFAGNGHVFNKADALAMMKRHVVRILAIETSCDGTAAAVVTYRVRSYGFGGAPGRISVRSSIWVQRKGKWQVTFHQATLIPGTAESA